MKLALNHSGGSGLASWDDAKSSGGGGFTAGLALSVRVVSPSLIGGDEMVGVLRASARSSWSSFGMDRIRNAGFGSSSSVTADMAKHSARSSGGVCEMPVQA